MNQKRTLVIGASENPARYSNLAIHSLVNKNIEVLALAKRAGNVAGIQIKTSFPNDENINTITMYIGPERQPEYYSAIINLKPQRVIFNPGTENREFYSLLKKNSIEVLEACTLVLLSTAQY